MRKKVYKNLWNFGDGATSSSASPSHSFQSTGVYNVSVKVWCKKCSPPPREDIVKVGVMRIVYTAYVDQPVPNQDDVIEWGNVGHSWLQFVVTPPEAMVDLPENLRPYVNIPVGYYSDGLHLNDHAHDSSLDVTRTFCITSKDSLISGLQYISGLDTPGQDIYSLCNFNCTDVTIQAAGAAGITLPDPQAPWITCSSGSAPGPFGQALRPLQNCQ